MKKTVAFANWLIKKGYYPNGKGRWALNYFSKLFATELLYKMFKAEKKKKRKSNH